MDAAWTVYLLAVIAAFAVMEGYALRTNRTTLSRYVWKASQAWPLLPFVVGVVVGGLAVHFWWHWCPV